jgi:hypothetical protein
MATVFPGNLFETQVEDCPRVICAQTESEMVVEIGNGVGWATRQIPMLAGTVYVAVKGLKFFDEPRAAKSDGSNAIYLANGGSGRRKFLLQYLRPEGVTSKHYHKQTIESFHLLAGIALVRTPGEVMLDFSSRPTIIVSPPTQHQLVTRKQDSLILLEMNYGADNLGMSDHFPADLLS